MHWFELPTPAAGDFDTCLERLRPFGIRWRDSSTATISYKWSNGMLMAEIGGLVVAPSLGLINVWPYADTGRREYMALLRAAQDAFETPPRQATGWRRLGKTKINPPRWSTAILVSINRSSETYQLVANQRERVVNEGLLALDKLDVTG